MGDSNDKIEEQFNIWLAKNAPSENISELHLCYSDINKFCQEEKILDNSIFDTLDIDTAKKISRTIIENKQFQSKHRKNMGRIVNAMQYYTAFVASLIKENEELKKSDDKAVNYNTSGNEKHFKRVLSERFIKGFRLGSAIDMKKFRRFYEEINNQPINKDDISIEHIIRNCGIIYENKVFLPENMLCEDVKNRLFKYIDDTFESGKMSIYYEALFQEFSDDFFSGLIYNSDMLRSYLDFYCGEMYIIGKNQISKKTSKLVDPINEVRNCLKNQGLPMKLESIYISLPHLPRSNIDAILRDNTEFVRNSKGEYFHADTIQISENDLENIANLIDENIYLHNYVSGTELINAIKLKYPRIYEGYSSYSTIGWRDALKYKLGDRFSFRGNIISGKDEALTMSDVFGLLTREKDVITVDELLTFAEEMGSGIYFDPVYENTIRIDEHTFVSKDRESFRVRETDAVLERFCVGDYIPLLSIQEFGIFPDAGFPWTIFLLESYVAFYSEEFMLMHSGYNRNCAVGAIVKKKAGYKDLDNLIVDIIASSNININKNCALDYLVDSGYIARRSYAGIDELLLRATARRNRKGKI